MFYGIAHEAVSNDVYTVFPIVVLSVSSALTRERDCYTNKKGDE